MTSSFKTLPSTTYIDPQLSQLLFNLSNTDMRHAGLPSVRALICIDGDLDLQEVVLLGQVKAEELVTLQLSHWLALQVLHGYTVVTVIYQLTKGAVKRWAKAISKVQLFQIYGH